MEDHAQAADGCRLPPELDDLTLIAAIDGEAAAEVMAHLRACSYCAARAHHFAELQGFLRKQLFRIFCPTSEALVVFQQGVLENDQRALIAAHVADCPHCGRELSLLKQLTQEPMVGRSPPEPWSVLNSAIHTLQSNNGGPQLGRRIRRIFAELLTPPARLVQAYGDFRGPSLTTQYAYQAENIQIIIGVCRLAHRADRRTITGMLEIDDSLPEQLIQATASLLKHDTPISTTTLDELGNFMLDDLAPGIYRLSLRLPDREVVIETLTL